MEMVLGAVVFVLLCAVALFELRYRSPDDLILVGESERIRVRSGALYPRHFSLALKRTTSPLELTVDASAVGNLGIRVKLVGAVAPAVTHLEALIRVGGWSTDAVGKASQELQLLLQEQVKELVEQHEVGALSSRQILEHLTRKAGVAREMFGLEVVSLVVQSLEPVDAQIADALRRQEQTRILEQTEVRNQQARINAARSKIRADEEIAKLESDMAIKKAELEKLQLENESALANHRLEDELRRNRLRLQFEREELEMLKCSPELLLLTPQAARLAEAGQSLKNAHTVISLSPQNIPQGGELLSLFQGFLQKALDEKRE